MLQYSREILTNLGNDLIVSAYIEKSVWVSYLVLTCSTLFSTLPNPGLAVPEGRRGKGSISVLTLKVLFASTILAIIKSYATHTDAQRENS
jgi:hypothetical protein